MSSATDRDEVPRRIVEMLERARCRLRRYGRAWRVTGSGVDLLVDHPARLRPEDLLPLDRAWHAKQ